MSARGWIVMVLAAAVGVGGGYAYADVSTRPAASGVPAPVAAADPAVPSTPVADLLPDSNLPPLPTELEMTPQEVGKPATGIELPVPSDWDRLTLGDTQARFGPPGHPEAAYSVRVAALAVTQSTQQMVASLAARLPLDGRLSHLELLDQTDDTLVFQYIFEDRHRVEQVVRWVSLNGGPAVAEIAASGRLIDEPGMKALVDTMAAGVRRQPPKPTTKDDQDDEPTGSASANGSSS